VRAQLLGDPAANPSSFGVGIRGITERVRELEGKLRIRNAMPGTIVEVILPLHREDSAGSEQSLISGLPTI